MGKRNAEAELQLPPGFRFFPTEEELVVHYLSKKAASQPLPVPIIADVDLYKFDPWQLPDMALFGEKEWYFFTPRDRKYPNGSRPNRAAGCGYWKATGADKPITSSAPSKAVKQKVGVKKALVFYRGKPPNGAKTNWLMHEYRLSDVSRPVRKKGNLRLDDWVLCRIYHRKVSAEKVEQERKQNFNGLPSEATDEQEMENQPTSTSIEHSGVEQSNLSFDHFSKMGPSPACYNVVLPRVSPMNPNLCFPNLDFFQNPTAPFTFSNVKAPVQNTVMNRISTSVNRQWKNCNPADLMSVLHNDSSSSRPSPFSEEVQSSFRLEAFSQEQQQPIFNGVLEGLQSTVPNFELTLAEACQYWIVS